MIWQLGLYGTAVLIPLIAFVVELAAGQQLGRRVGHVATGAIGFSFLLSLVGFVSYFSQAQGVFAETATTDSAPADHHTLPLVWRGELSWVDLGSKVPPVVGKRAGEPLSIRLGLDVDNLTVLMFLMVTFVATVVHVFAIAYMRDDLRYPRCFAYLSLFCGSMLLLVVSSNLFFVFVAWELVGFCSYLLIGHWHEEIANVNAATKAFLVNRVGDVGMILGLGLIWANLGTFDIREINDQIRDEHGQLNVRTVEGLSVVELVNPATGRISVEEASGHPRRIGYGMLVLAGLGLFAGCVGKSTSSRSMSGSPTPWPGRLRSRP